MFSLYSKLLSYNYILVSKFNIQPNTIIRESINWEVIKYIFFHSLINFLNAILEVSTYKGLES